MRCTFVGATTGILVLCLGAVQVEAETYELAWSLDAVVREARLQGEVLAGGRLLFEGERQEDGGYILRLSEVVEVPWKLYWVDPWGPFGEEVKVASVIDLEEGSWEALEAARAAAEASARSRYAEWAASRTPPPALDGAFAFVVIGPAAGRLLIEIPPSGMPAEVTNQLTDRWLSGRFDQWVTERWPSVEPGYWFWNATESGPFDYEPHAYHAIVEALPMLMAASQKGDETWARSALGHAQSALGVLVPKLAARIGWVVPEEIGLQSATTRSDEHERYSAGGPVTVDRWTAEGGSQTLEVRIEQDVMTYRLRLELTSF